jgi:hypothetical protein
VNVQLTKRRAQAVVDALIKRQVDPRRMHARGYGNYCQVDPGDAEASREKNRRVEFKIMRIDGVETGVALGCENASSKGIGATPVPKTAPTHAELQKVRDEHPPTPPPRNPNPPPASMPAASAQGPAPATGPAPAPAPTEDAGVPPVGAKPPPRPIPVPAAKPPAPKPTVTKPPPRPPTVKRK